MTGAAATAPAPAPLIRIAGLSQSYGPVTVLDDVSLELRPGEVHALLGANGAGKSTLIKVLAGLVDYDRGAIEVCGEDVPRRTVGHALTRLGLAFVHQDLGLLDHMTVSENIALATGYARRRGLVDFAGTAAAARRATEELGLDIDPRRLVGELDTDAKVMVAVARAFALRARAIVLDEVSSSLPAPQVSRLLTAIRGSTHAGLGYIYVTHRLDELFGLADRVTVLRDGRVAVSEPMAQVDKRRLIEAIVEPGAGGIQPAAAAGDDPPRPVPAGSGIRLRVTGLRVREHSPEISFAVERGQIVALCGLVGSGVRDVVRVLGGDTRPFAGTAELDGRRLPFGHPPAVRDAGCSYVPGDRQGEGIVPGMTIRENLFLTRRGGQRQPGNGVLRAPRAERRLAGQLSALVAVRPAGSTERPVISLSGGNQQKVVCGRALRTQPRLLVLDDPTAGVDIGSRAQVHELIRSAAADGAAVVFASTDYEEVAHLAGRALVIVGGAVHADLEGADLTEASLATASYGGDTR